MLETCSLKNFLRNPRKNEKVLTLAEGCIEGENVTKENRRIKIKCRIFSEKLLFHFTV
jgi:hypothetical protein